ncbi:MAG: ester cyclase [Deltaproteobacteria bacterium]|nr:ester cyclase [Deltaproteobacteria bacterium]
MSAKENEALVRRFLEEAYNKGNLAIGDELLTANCVFRTPGAIEGIAGWKQFATAFLTAFPEDLHITIDDTVAEGDKVAARWTARGTHKGPLRGIAPTGKPVTWIGIAIYQLSGGKIKEVWGLNDALGIMQQIGAIPSK